MTPDVILMRTDKVQFSRLDDELLAIDADAGLCYGLNETAAAMWTALDTPASIAALVERLRRSYAVDEATCLAEVTAAAVDLERSGLLRIVPEPTPA